MDNNLQLLDTLRQQEEDLQFRQFDNNTALRLGMQIVEVARQGRKAITVDIVRNGHQLFHCALPGTAPDNDAWVRRKSNVVTRFGHSSYYPDARSRLDRAAGHSPRYACRTCGSLRSAEEAWLRVISPLSIT